jgi:hypothetical protein
MGAIILFSRYVLGFVTDAQGKIGDLFLKMEIADSGTQPGLTAVGVPHTSNCRWEIWRSPGFQKNLNLFIRIAVLPWKWAVSD